MENQSSKLYEGTGIVEFNPVQNKPPHGYIQEHSLSSRADDVLVAVAVLGLVATVADGEADYREVKEFTRSFQEFVLSKSDANRIIGIAIKQMRSRPPENVIDCPCETLNEYLNLSQKMRLFDGLAAVLVADGVVHKNEEHFLDYIAMKLDLVEALKEKFPIDEQEEALKEAAIRWS